MKTFNQKFVWGLIGALTGAILGYLICAFIGGTLNPFDIRAWDWEWINGVYTQTETRSYGIEGMARFGWVVMICGGGYLGGLFGVYLVGKK